MWFQNSRARQKKYKEKKIDANSTLDLNDTESNDENWNGNMEVLEKKRFNSMNQYQVNSNDFPIIMNENKINIYKENKSIRQKSMSHMSMGI